MKYEFIQSHAHKRSHCSETCVDLNTVHLLSMCRCSQSHSHTPRPHLLTPFSYHIYGISYLRPCALDWVLCPPLVPFVLRVLARALAVILCVHCDTHDRCAKEWRTIRARLRTSAFIKRFAHSMHTCCAARRHHHHHSQWSHDSNCARTTYARRQPNNRFVQSNAM